MLCLARLLKHYFYFPRINDDSLAIRQARVERSLGRSDKVVSVAIRPVGAVRTRNMQDEVLIRSPSVFSQRRGVRA